MLPDIIYSLTLSFQSPVVLKVGREQPIIKLELPSKRVWVDKVEICPNELFRARDIWRKQYDLATIDGCGIDLKLRCTGFEIRLYSSECEMGDRWIRYTNSLNYIELYGIRDRNQITISNITEHGRPREKGFLEYFLDAVDELEQRLNKIEKDGQ